MLPRFRYPKKLQEHQLLMCAIGLVYWLLVRIPHCAFNFVFPKWYIFTRRSLIKYFIVSNNVPLYCHSFGLKHLSQLYCIIWQSDFIDFCAVNFRHCNFPQVPFYHHLQLSLAQDQPIINNQISFWDGTSPWGPSCRASKSLPGRMLNRGREFEIFRREASVAAVREKYDGRDKADRSRSG